MTDAGTAYSRFAQTSANTGAMCVAYFRVLFCPPRIFTVRRRTSAYARFAQTSANTAPSVVAFPCAFLPPRIFVLIHVEDSCRKRPLPVIPQRVLAEKHGGPSGLRCPTTVACRHGPRPRTSRSRSAPRNRTTPTHRRGARCRRDGRSSTTRRTGCLTISMRAQEKFSGSALPPMRPPPHLLLPLPRPLRPTPSPPPLPPPRAPPCPLHPPRPPRPRRRPCLPQWRLQRRQARNRRRPITVLHRRRRPTAPVLDLARLRCIVRRCMPTALFPSRPRRRIIKSASSACRRLRARTSR